ncbi:hypothetical protein C8R44DRAFT_750820 [Mycena epipterygia]|nr:hypothetical protein C8R44DRAFT_750820 [Mycena epipterygia]
MSHDIYHKYVNPETPTLRRLPNLDPHQFPSHPAFAYLPRLSWVKTSSFNRRWLSIDTRFSALAPPHPPIIIRHSVYSLVYAACISRYDQLCGPVNATQCLWPKIQYAAGLNVTLRVGDANGKLFYVWPLLIGPSSDASCCAADAGCVTATSSSPAAGTSMPSPSSRPPVSTLFYATTVTVTAKNSRPSATNTSSARPVVHDLSLGHIVPIMVYLEVRIDADTGNQEFMTKFGEERAVTKD